MVGKLSHILIYPASMLRSDSASYASVISKLRLREKKEEEEEEETCACADLLLELVRRVGCQLDLTTYRRRVGDNAHTRHVCVGVHAKDDVDDELFGDVPVV